MGIAHYLFGFSGRINRAKMWLYLLIVMVFVIVAMIAVFSAFGMANIVAVSEHKADPSTLMGPAVLPTFGILGLVYLAMLWAGLAVAAKRLHDRDKSAWWLLIFIVLPALINGVRAGMMISAMHTDGGAAVNANPIAMILGLVALGINIWAFVELYCLRGTVGENQYGSDPLA